MENDFSYQFYSTTSQAWSAMYQAVLGATRSVYWEVYTFIDDETGNKFIDLLCQKAEQGVEVKMVVDGVGSLTLSRISINRLKACGAEVLIFNSVSFDLNFSRWWLKIWSRTHCKVLVIDENTAFIGGVNIQHQMAEWDDLHLRLSGIVVRQLVRYFAKEYIRAGGRRKGVKHLLHPKLVYGLEELRNKIRFITQAPYQRSGRSPFRKLYRHALAAAKESFNLITPYYVPDPKFLELIYRASRRGVKINIIMPYKSDVRLMYYMAKAFYGISKRAGATFYFLKKMNHGKAMTSDSSLGMVGSVNLTPRSFFINHEAGVAFTNQDMVNELNGILTNWRDQADPLLELDFKRQGWFRRFKSWWVLKLKDHV